MRSALSLTTKAAVSAGVIFAARKLFAGSTTPKVDLRDKVVLITGGSRGLGLALAFELGSRGCRLALCARYEEELQEACRRLREKEIEAAPFPCDVADASQIDPLITRVIGHFGRMDVLINNAGLIKVGPLEAFDHADFEDAMNLMFWAPVNLTFAVLPHMNRQRSGHIVNITSIGGRVSVPHLLPYTCAKFALVGFSTGLSTEVRANEVHVLTVVPGLMRTGSYLNAQFAGAAKSEFAWFGLLGNLPGFSVAASYAASSIRKALENKRQICTISLPARLLIAAEALIPETMRSALQFVNCAVLPKAKQQNTVASGKLLNPEFSKLFQALTALGKTAALKFNE